MPSEYQKKRAAKKKEVAKVVSNLYLHFSSHIDLIVLFVGQGRKED
jgi:hypothetical protein